MPKDVTFEQVQYYHSLALINEMRPLDKRELWALSRFDPATAVAQAVEQSDIKFAVTDTDGLVCIVGVHTPVAVGGLGIPWLLGTPRMERHKLTLLRETKKFLKHVLTDRFDRLENLVWEGNMPSIMYLEAVGFRMSPRRVTRTGEGYYRFWMDKEDV